MQTFGAAMLAHQSNNGILGAISLNNNAGSVEVLTPVSLKSICL